VEKSGDEKEVTNVSQNNERSCNAAIFLLSYEQSGLSAQETNAKTAW